MDQNISHWFYRLGKTTITPPHTHTMITHLLFFSLFFFSRVQHAATCTCSKQASQTIICNRANVFFPALYDNSIDVGRTTKPTAFLTAGNITYKSFTLFQYWNQQTSIWLLLSTCLKAIQKQQNKQYCLYLQMNITVQTPKQFVLFIDKRAQDRQGYLYTSLDLSQSLPHPCCKKKQFCCYALLSYSIRIFGSGSESCHWQTLQKDSEGLQKDQEDARWRPRERERQWGLGMRWRE